MKLSSLSILLSIAAISAAAGAATPPVPQNLQAVLDEGGENILLTWDAKAEGDDSTDTYRVYINTPLDDVWYWNQAIDDLSPTGARNSIGQIRGEWQVAVTAVSADDEESERTAPVTVIAHTLILHPVANRFVEIVGNKAKVTWRYPDDIWDLAGFRISLDGKQVADEKLLGPTAREWISPALEPGIRHRITFHVVTTSGLVSKESVASADVTPGKQSGFPSKQ